MRKLLIIPILFIVLVSFFRSKFILFVAYKTGNIHCVKEGIQLSNGIRYHEYAYLFDDIGNLLYERWFVNYTWSAGNTSINLTNGTFPVNANDTVFIPLRGGGYRSYSMNNFGRVNMGGYAHVIWQTGAFITPNAGGNLFANTMDSVNWIHIYGENMSHHTDPLMFTYQSTAHSHYIWWDSITINSMPGMFGSGPPSSSIPAFTGSATDTINMFWGWKFTKIMADSIGGVSSGGLTVIWMGDLDARQVWGNTEIAYSHFNYLPSQVAGASAIHAQLSFMLRIHNDTVNNIGVVAFPTGHAAAGFFQGCQVEAWDNYFTRNFSNCFRTISSATIPGMDNLFSRIDPTYDEVSRFWNTILDSGRKYPMYETQMDTIGLTEFAWLRIKRSARYWESTFYRGGMGAGGHGPYNVSTMDFYRVSYTVDTLELHNCVEVGPPTDTTATVCNGTACVALITIPNGAPSRYDTSGNQFYQLMTFATSGLLDTTKFYPKNGSGILYNNGVAVPSWLTADYYGQPIPAVGRPAFARNTGVDVGAVQAQPAFVSIPYGSKIITH